MPEGEKSEKPKQDEGAKSGLSRREFLHIGLAGVAVGALLAGFPLLERSSKRKLAERKRERDKKNNSETDKSKISTEEAIKKSNEDLNDFESDLRESKLHLTELEELLNEIDKVVTSEHPQKLDDIGIYEQILKNLIERRQRQESVFLEYQDRFDEINRNINILLADQNNLDKQGLLKKWDNEEYLPRKTRIEEQMKSFNTQNQELDKNFNTIITKMREEVQKAKEGFKNKIKYKVA